MRILTTALKTTVLATAPLLILASTAQAVEAMSADGATIDNAVGGRFPNAPHHQAGLWSRYQIPAWGTALALGGQYVSGQIDRRGAHIPGFTVFDGSITQDLGFAEAMIRVENIFDKTYAVATFDARKGAFVGRPRTVFLELRRDICRSRPAPIRRGYALSERLRAAGEIPAGRPGAKRNGRPAAVRHRYSRGHPPCRQP